MPASAGKKRQMSGQVSRASAFFFFNDTATTEIYTLSLHDALPICRCRAAQLASIRQMSGQVSRGSAGEYQADERAGVARSEEHTSELQSPLNLVCRLLLEKKKKTLQMK